MRELSDYTYQELYELMHNINPYKYPERVEQVTQEITFRKEKGEVPEQLIPEIDWEPLKFWK